VSWYTGLWSSRTHYKHTYPVTIKRNKLQAAKLSSKKYRNPVIYAKELHDEMVRDNLTRKHLAARHCVSSDRITQWLCLLKLPEETLRNIEAMGDYWDRKVVTERELRNQRRLQGDIEEKTRWS
jgi:hypothetical protein